MKKKTKIASAIGATLLTTLALFGAASAAESMTNVSASANLKIKTGTTSTEASTTVRGNATSSAMRNDNASTSTPKGNATSTEAKNEHASSTVSTQGELMSETHRSTVATFVKSLLAVADREGGIGVKVREIAKSQNDSSSTTVSAIAKVDGRGSVRTFFFGSDYKNLGVIRSEIATTTNNIEKLKALLTETVNPTDRAELEAQIKVLEAEQVELNAYVKKHESVFSLFGWFNKLFVK